jgi:hypothetical protein
MPNQLHDDVLNFLETYRTKHPDFVYWLRQPYLELELTKR